MKKGSGKPQPAPRQRQLLSNRLHERKPASSESLEKLLRSLFSVGISMALGTAGRWVSRVVINIVTPLVKTYAGLFVVEVLFIAGAYGLFELKKRLQRLYGGLECIFAMSAAWFILGRIKESGLTTDQLVGLIGAGYILVRGLTNYSDGVAAQRLRDQST